MHPLRPYLGIRFIVSLLERPQPALRSLDPGSFLFNFNFLIFYCGCLVSLFIIPVPRCNPPPFSSSSTIGRIHNVIEIAALLVKRRFLVSSVLYVKAKVVMLSFSVVYVGKIAMYISAGTCSFL